MKKPNNEEGIRLAKRMAQLGICSRREADDYILKGWVKVNGKTILQKGFRISEWDEITITKDAQQQQSGRVTILLNKPVGYVSAQAEKNYKAAAELVHPKNHWEGDRSGIRYQARHRHGLAPAGRLDIDSVGLLILTQDGVLARKIIGEQSTVEKEYIVKVEGTIQKNGLQLLNHGLELDNEPLLPAQVDWHRPNALRFILQQGKKRQIRRMCALVGLQVVGLQRIRIGKIHLANLPYGKWRYLRPNEQV